MGCEYLACFLNGFHERVAEFLVLEVAAHSLDKPLPELLAAFFMDRFVAHDREFVCARRHKNKHSIALVCFMHGEPMKFFLSSGQRIVAQLSSLNINADLPGSFFLRVPNRLPDAIVLELAQEFLRSHFFTSSSPRLRHRNYLHLR